MPGFNQKGTSGQGPMTGRKMGRCTNFGENIKKQPEEIKENTVENFPEKTQGNGLGFGRKNGGRGFGNRNGQGFGNRRQNRFRTDI
jgi:hypothetical protein